MTRPEAGEIWLVDSTYNWKGCLVLVWKNLGDGVVTGEVLDMEIYVDKVMEMQPAMPPDEFWRFYKTEFVCKLAKLNKRKAKNKERRKEMYKIGDTFISEVLRKLDIGKLRMYYVLVQVDSFQVALIGLNSWTKWTDSVKVKDIHAITNVEFKEISSSGKFKRCNKEEAFECLLRACVGK